MWTTRKGVIRSNMRQRKKEVASLKGGSLIFNNNNNEKERKENASMFLDTYIFI